MNFIKKHILRFIAAMSLCVVAASCSQEELGITPDGIFPLKFTATVDGMVSRANDTDSWADGDTIRVRIDTYPWIGRYSLNADGTIKSAIEALAWPYPNGRVSAWFPFFGNEGTEVSISDQSKGFHSFDFLSAQTEEQKNYKEIINLNFEHQMTKVHCNLIKGDGITEEDLATAKVSYYGFTSVTFSENGLTGNGNGLINTGSTYEALLLPQDMSGKPFIKVDLTVYVNRVPIPKTLIYTPESGKGKLEAGTFYTFNVTVQKDRLVVEPISGAWDDKNGPEYADQVLYRINLPQGHEQTISFSSNVTTMPKNATGGDIEYLLVKGREFSISCDMTDDNYVKGFVPTVKDADKLTMEGSNSEGMCNFNYKMNPQTENTENTDNTVNLVYDEYVQVGDIYFSDGTWSRELIEGRIPVGIVFKTDLTGTGDGPGTYGWGSTRRIRGYVVALTDAYNKIAWAKGTGWNKYFTVPYSESTTDPQQTTYSGYVNTNKMRTDDPDGIYSKVDLSSTSPSGLLAFKAAVEYRPANLSPGEPSAPTKNKGCSGWYLPSIRQLLDLSALFKLGIYLEKAGGTKLSNGQTTNDGYWSCTEVRGASNSCSSAFSYTFIKTTTNTSHTKTASGNVRSVLTF